MNNQICKILVGKSNFEFESAEAIPADLQTIITNDKAYGVMKPKNGKFYTWAILNEDTEVSKQEMKKIVTDVVSAYEFEFNVDFQYTDDYTNADIKMSFGDEGKDPNLTSNTIAYMGYPFPNSEFYGICVINRKFTYTHDGEPRTGEEMILMGIPVQFKDGTYGTLFLVKILMHEWGHGIGGLPHDPTADNIMSSNEGIMAKYWSPRDLFRMYAKLGQKIKENKFMTRLKRLREWFKIGSKR